MYYIFSPLFVVVHVSFDPRPAGYETQAPSCVYFLPHHLCLRYTPEIVVFSGKNLTSVPCSYHYTSTIGRVGWPRRQWRVRVLTTRAIMD